MTVAPGIAEALIATAVGLWQRFQRSSPTMVWGRIRGLKPAWKILGMTS